MRDAKPPRSQTLPESISILTFTSLLFASDHDHGPSHPFIQSICACPNGCSYQFPGSGGSFVFLSSIPKLCELNCCSFQVRSPQAADKASTCPLRRSRGRGSVGSTRAEVCREVEVRADGSWGRFMTSWCSTFPTPVGSRV